MSRKKTKRPTGTIKRINVINTPTGMPVVLPDEVFAFPHNKEDAEEVAMQALFRELQYGYVQYKFESYCRHPKEDGPDFDIVWNGKDAHVELVELAPLKGPYETAQRVFTVEEMANALVRLVHKKNEKYKARGYFPLFLLIYITDDAFYVAEDVLLVVAHMLQVGSPHVFEAVFFVSFWADKRAHMRMPYPHHENLLLLNTEPYLKKQVINPAAAEMKVVSRDPSTNSIVVRQYLPKGANLTEMVESVKAQLPGLEQALEAEK